MNKKIMGKGQASVCGTCNHEHGSGCDDCRTCGQEKSCGGGMCYGMPRHGGCWGWVLKFIVFIFILTIVFSVGMLAGVIKTLRSGYEMSVVGPTGMMGWRGMMNGGLNWMMGGGRYGSDRVFGVVSSINGQNISYTDNGGKTGVIISSSATTIIAGNVYAGLSAIKAGQTISAYGTLNQSGELQATWITAQ